MKSLSRLARFVVVALLLSLAPEARAQCAQEALAGLGPVSPFGFPGYYVDQGGQGLEMCFNIDDPLCGAIGPLPNPGAPLAVASGNFLPEAPYSFVTSTMTLPTGGQALLVLSVLGTWGNPTGAVIDGTQTVFSRVRFRIDTPQGGLYTLTYPFGVMTLRAAAGGRRSINFTEDCLLRVPATCGQGIGNFFTTPLDPTQSHIGHFLAWDPAESAPPPGYVGNPAIPHTVIGSPCGTNFFRVEGPGLPPGGVQTPLFSVQGKEAQICGNGVLDRGEQCDDGNTLNGDCCSSTCTIDPAGTACNDGNVCTGPDVCAGTTPTCRGAAISCNDGNVCTTDSCDPVLGCQHVNNTIGCSDANACTVGDTCSGGVCVRGPGPNCDDGNACTVDGCNTLTGCTHTPVTCNDGNACTTDACDPATGCTQAPVNCDDGNTCTVDSCNPAKGCAHTPVAVGTVCDDGNAATKFDACTAAGQCVGVRLLAPLTRTAGEDPSKSATIRATGDGRWNGTTARVRLTNMDPARYPAGSACRVDVTAGALAGAGTISNTLAGSVAVTNMDFARTGTIRTGDTVSIRIRCTVAGVRHETQWSGRFAQP